MKSFGEIVCKLLDETDPKLVLEAFGVDQNDRWVLDYQLEQAVFTAP